jgi:hypothetical protein
MDQLGNPPQPTPPVTQEDLLAFQQQQQQHVTAALDELGSRMASLVATQVAAAVHAIHAQQPAASSQTVPLQSPPSSSPVQLPSAFKLPKPLPFTGKPRELAPWLFSP